MENTVLKSIRDKTKTDLIDKLNRFGRCALLRCTGFGKTWLLADLASDYNTVLYLYPSDIIKQTAVYASDFLDEQDEKDEMEVKGEIDKELGYEFDFKNIKFMSYAKLARVSKDYIESLPDYDLVIMDEVHKLGGEMTKRNALLLMYSHQKSHYIGATATPERLDAFDVIEEFFYRITTYPYTLHDAVQDGIIKMPYYVYCTYDIETEFKKAARLAGQDRNNPIVKDCIDSKLLEACKIHNMPTIIKKTCNAVVEDTSYMKFIAFFSQFKQLYNHIDDVTGWFKSAFPKHKINVLIITSETTETRKNLSKLDIEHKKNTIDIIACVDMLNMGYHVNDLTGIVMYRCTISSTVYVQQFGRALSTGTDKPCVCFDVVDNLHRKAIYNLNVEGKRRKVKGVTKKERVERMLNDVKELLSEREIELMEAFISDNLQADDLDEFNKTYYGINKIEESDLNAIDHLAEYRELIAKTVFEIKHERIKRAAGEYFRIKRDKCNVPIPNNIKDLKKMKNIPPELQIFLKWQSITEEDLLEYLDPDKTGLIQIDKIENDIKVATMLD